MSTIYAFSVYNGALLVVLLVQLSTPGLLVYTYLNNWSHPLVLLNQIFYKPRANLNGNARDTITKTVLVETKPQATLENESVFNRQ